jgi:hypothetical protein
MLWIVAECGVEVCCSAFRISVKVGVACRHVLKVACRCSDVVMFILFRRVGVDRLDLSCVSCSHWYNFGRRFAVEIRFC